MEKHAAREWDERLSEIIWNFSAYLAPTGCTLREGSPEASEGTAKYLVFRHRLLRGQSMIIHPKKLGDLIKHFDACLPFSWQLIKTMMSGEAEVKPAPKEHLDKSRETSERYITMGFNDGKGCHLGSWMVGRRI